MDATQNMQVQTLTVKDVKAKGYDFRAAVKAIRSENERTATVHGQVMWNAAVILAEVKRRGLVGKNAGAAGWPTQVAYATDAGYKESTGSLLATLARAVDKGVKVGSPEWSYLVQSGTSAEVSKAVKDAKNLTALKGDLKRIRTAPPAPKKTGAKKTGDEKKQTTPKVKSTVKDVAVALNAIRLALHDLDSKQWREVRDLMEKQVKDENHRRQLLAQRAQREAAKDEGKALAPTG